MNHQTEPALKLLAFADLHGSTTRALSLAKTARDAEVHGLICAGDFSNLGGAWKEAIAPLILSERKLVCIPGNHEPPGLMADVVETFPWVIDLDGNGMRLGPFVLLGFGAVGLDHPGWDPEPALAELEELAGEAESSVLISHVPPATAGMTERLLWQFCERVAPTMVICGHVHRQEGRRFSIGATEVVCVGRRGEIVEIPAPACQTNSDEPDAA